MDTIPSREACLDLLKRRGVPTHVIVHSLQVDRVAQHIAALLNARGERLDVPLIQAASLLHDIAKLDGLRTGENHARAGAAILQGLGWPRVARVVAQHVEVQSVPSRVRVTEEELVNYADKRVMHDRIVTLEERFEDLKARYGRNAEGRAIIGDAMERTREMERRIFRRLPFAPHELLPRLEAGPGA
jgi:putative nucleotidyltransferase with HDIG domain